MWGQDRDDGFSGRLMRVAGLAAAGLLSANLATAPAAAADLGGDCCADLEERVAELEATTVRKGNRVMSVQLSGQINRAIMWWDDGDESNVYVVDNDYATSRLNISGEAVWKPGWSVGFALEWEQVDESSKVVNANTDDAPSGPVERLANWWLKSNKWGKVTVGQLESATDGTPEVNLSGATDYTGNSTQSNNAGFALVNGPNNRSALAWGDISPDNLSGLSRQDGVRYDTPTFGGFTLSTGWYEDDMWDVALRFAKEWKRVQFAAAVGYAEDSETGGIGFCGAGLPGNASNGGGNNADCGQISASASIRHIPTGLFASIGYAQASDDNRNAFAVSNGLTPGVSVDDEADALYANAGIYRRFNEHGKTSIGVEYYNGECGFGSCGGNFGGGVDGVGFVSGTETRMFGAWIGQDIDNAATTFYVDYHHFEADVDFVNAAGASLQGPAYRDMDIVKAGAIVHF